MFNISPKDMIYIDILKLSWERSIQVLRFFSNIFFNVLGKMMFVIQVSKNAQQFKIKEKKFQ